MEFTVWGLLGLDERVGPLVTWKLDVNQRWALIMERAPEKHSSTAIERLRRIGRHLSEVTRDRNIIVKGVIRAKAHPPAGLGFGDPVLEVGKSIPFTRLPCWSIFRGGTAAKNFLVSTDAARTVRENIQRLNEALLRFNADFRYTTATPITDEIEQHWPKAIAIE
ncbi:hypothetical protein [Bradyrhizobium sp. UFLA01-814]|uniref:hypothetical protein n=1 Tax=Bradyrhizobium sp. UFLA01-814 TaxID=3023480 RepID=UPI00398B1CCB